MKTQTRAGFLFFVVLVFISVILGGCGGGGGSSSSGSTGAAPSNMGPIQAPSTARIVVHFPGVTRGAGPASGEGRVARLDARDLRGPVALETSLPAPGTRTATKDASQADVFRFYGLDASGNVVFGPQDYARAPEVVLEGVPVAVVALRVEFIQGGRITSVVATTVALSAGGITTVENPDTPANALTTLQVTTGRASLPQGTSVGLTAVGLFANGLRQDLTSSVTWTSSSLGTASLTSSGSGVQAHANGVGSAILTASIGGVSGGATLTVTAAEIVSVAVTPASPTLPAGLTQTLTATGTFSDASVLDVTAQASWTSSDTGVATVTGGLVLAVTPGTAVVTATVSGVSGTARVQVDSAVLQTISVTPANPSLARGLTQPMTATGTFSDHSTRELTEQVAWSSSAPGMVAISNLAGSRGLASGVTVGQATITASSGGVDGSTLVTVTPALLGSIAVTPTNPSAPLGVTRQFTATGIYSDSSTQDLTATVTWSSSDPSIATISNASDHGLATPVKVGGPVTITATDPTTSKSATTPLTVTAAVLQSLAVTPTNPSAPLGVTHQFTATGIYSDSTTQDLTATVTWSSSDPTTATIDNASNHGLATPVKVGGPVTITATDPTTSKTATTQLTVTAAVLQSIAVTPTNPSTPLGAPRQFTATGTYSDNTTQDITSTVTWSSSDPTTATISNASDHGLAATLNVGGPVTITATDPATSKTASTQFTVSAAVVQAIEVTPTSMSVPLGLTVRFTALARYTDNTTRDITTTGWWSSSDPTVATISNSIANRGALTALRLGGPVTITAYDYVTTRTGTSTVTVTNASLQSISVTPGAPSTPLDLPVDFSATGRYSDNTTHDFTSLVTWTSSDPTIATLDNATHRGRATPLQVGGPITVTATDPATSIVGTTTLTVTSAVLQSLTVYPASWTIPVTKTRAYTATASYSDSSTHDVTNIVTWSSSDPSIAAIDNAGTRGLATGISVGGPVTITAIHPATSTSASTSLTVSSGASTGRDFRGGVTLPVTTNINSLLAVALGDVNRDGRLDIVVTDMNNMYWVILGNATPGFAAPVSHALSGTPQDVLVADVNGDSLLDLVLACSDGVHVLLGNGDGTFAAGSTFGTFSYFLRLADVNNDGRADLVVTEGINVSTWLSQGDGTFTFVQRIPETTNMGRVAVADFNEDGKPDLAYVLTQYDRLIYRPGAGDGTFGDKTTLTTSTWPWAATSADYNRDGHADIVAGTQVYLGKGDGTFSTPTAFRTTEPGYTDTTDLNGDGKADLVSIKVHTSAASFQLGNGDGTFGPVITAAGGTIPNRVAIGDLNGDGRPDAVIANQRGNLFLLPGSVDGVPESPTSTHVGGNPSPISTQAVDFNRDGVLDAMIVDGYGQKVGVALGLGDGTFATPTWLGVANTQDTWYAVAGDLNGDGIPDLVTDRAGSVTVQLGVGDGTFQAAVTYPLFVGATTNGAGPLCLTDANGDGRLDVMVVDTYNHKIQALLGNGNGTLQASVASSLGATVTGSYTLAVADFNGDHVPDLVFEWNGDKTARTLLGNGDGTFRVGGTHVVSPPVEQTILSVAGGDVNGDGKADIVALTSSGNVSVLLGNGDDTFQAPTLFAAGGQGGNMSSRSPYLRVADLNGDGIHDVVACSQGSDTLGIFYGSSGGSLGTADVYAIGGGPSAVDVGDFNGDGRVDILCTNYNSHTVVVLFHR